MKYDTEPGKVRGRKLTLGSHDYIVPPLNLEGFEQHEEDIANLVKNPEMGDFDRLRVVCEVALSAIQRNYPEVTMAFLKKWVDLGNMQEVFEAVMAQSGLRPVEPGEALAGPSTGPLFTPTLSQQPGGNGSTSPST